MNKRKKERFKEKDKLKVRWYPTMFFLSKFK